MTPLAKIRPGDVVICDVRGRVFWAQVVQKEKPEVKGGAAFLQVRPITPGINYLRVKGAQVTAVYRWRP